MVLVKSDILLSSYAGLSGLLCTNHIIMHASYVMVNFSVALLGCVFEWITCDYTSYTHYRDSLNVYNNIEWRNSK